MSVAALAIVALGGGWERNMAAIMSSKGLLNGEAASLQAAEKAWEGLATTTCRAHWHLGMIAQAAWNIPGRDSAWERAVECSNESLTLVRSVVPDGTHFAQLAVTVHPSDALAWFWLGEAQMATNPAAAIQAFWQGLILEPDNNPAWVNLGRILAGLPPEVAAEALANLDLTKVKPTIVEIEAEKLFIIGAAVRQIDRGEAVARYQEGLRLNPSDGVRWYELGDMLAESSLQEALEAYYQACLFGDPGNHGCYNAGRMAEMQGKIADAIRYYRMSDWEPALQRANELEK